MYRAKQRGRGRIEVFDARLQEEAVERLDAESALRQAIAQDDFEVHYQPIVRLPDRARAGRRGAGALAPPARRPAGAAGRLHPARRGDRADRADRRDRAAPGHPPGRRLVRRRSAAGGVRLFVNLSARQLTDPACPPRYATCSGAGRCRTSALCLELTESAVAADPEAAQAMLAQLDALGVRLAIDDFGAGHSSLGQLSRVLPISVLKLDRSFVASMQTTRDRGIVLAAAALARALQVTSVAEGVESQEQARELAEMGFALAQGYHFGRPVAAGELTALLAGSALS